MPGLKNMDAIPAAGGFCFLSLSSWGTKKIDKNIQQRGFANGHPLDY
jgi:hypothetical protein